MSTAASVDFQFFLRSIRDNRFIPQPEADRIFVGGGDFRQNGIDALNSLVHLADLEPNSRVLEIGSGIGRMALPLTQWLSTGSYVGIEIVMEGVAWCLENIARRYPNFRFLHLDLYNEHYNPTGRGSIVDVGLPFESGSFDVVFLTSVFTHLTLEDTRGYLGEIARVLTPGGRLWGSWFLVDEGIGETVLDGRAHEWVPLGWADGAGVYYADAQRGTAVVAYDDALVRRLLNEANLAIRYASKGEWLSSRTHIDGGFQDVLVCEKARAAGAR